MAGQGMLGIVLLVNLVLYLIIMLIASWAFDVHIDNILMGGNGATSDFIRFSLVSGVVGLASIIGGGSFIHFKRESEKGAATSLAILAWAITMLAFGMACKHINFGFVNNDTLKTLEAFDIIVAVTQSAYVFLLHSTEHRI